MPGAKQHWPKSAACWSPSTPEIGRPSSTAPAAPRSGSRVVPNRPAEGRTSGSVCRGTPNSAQRSSDQARVAVSSSMVRLAFEGSVANSPPCGPPVRLHSSQLSTVPKARSADSGPRASAPCRSSQVIFVAVKYGSSTSPVLSRTMGRCPAPSSSVQMSAVRRSCQTMARANGCPLERSNATSVSR